MRGEHLHTLEKVQNEGFVRVRVNGIIHDLSEEIKLNINDIVSCETASALSAAYAEQQFSNMQTFMNSESGADAILFCDSLYIAEQKIWEAFDRYNELKTDRKAVVDDLVSTQ